MIRVARIVCILSLFTALVPVSRAHAQGYFSPFIGTTFNTPDVGSVKNGSEKGFGLDLGTFGGIVGFEFDVAYFPKVLDNEVIGLEKNRVVTVTFNGIVNAPIGRVRPYGTFGAGYLRLNITGLDASVLPDSSFKQNKFAWSLGGGVFAFFTEGVGIRGDVRYFRAVGFDGVDLGSFNLNQFDFWRASVGLALKY
jgi:opacity protein-like surface antigen